MGDVTAGARGGIKRPAALMEDGSARVQPAVPGDTIDAVEEDASDAAVDEDSDAESSLEETMASDGGAPDDAAVRRAHFLKAMRNRFIQGLEPGFDYSHLDEDSELDDLVEQGRDAEERYFDGE